MQQVLSFVMSCIMLMFRQERIAQLELEVNQCKAHLAAHAGDKQLLLTYLHGDDCGKQRWQILQEQLKYAVPSSSDFFLLI